MKRTRLRRRTPLKTAQTPVKRSRLAPVGKRAKRRASALRAAYAATRERSGGVCEVPYCQARADDVHHRLPRSLGPSFVTEPANCVHLCRPHHDKCETDRQWARRLGLLYASHEWGLMLAGIPAEN